MSSSPHDIIDLRHRIDSQQKIKEMFESLGKLLKTVKGLREQLAREEKKRHGLEAMLFKLNSSGEMVKCTYCDNMIYQKDGRFSRCDDAFCRAEQRRVYLEQQRVQRQQEKLVRFCPGCGVEIPALAHGRRKWCTDECRNKNRSSAKTTTRTELLS